MADGVLLQSWSLYLFLYNAEQGSYTQQTDSVLGCVLLSDEGTFSLLLYDTNKKPQLQLPVTPSVRFVPQQNDYVNFYDRQTQQNYAMRFKDATSSESFLAAVAYTKSQVLLHSSKAFDQSRTKPLVLVDQLTLGKDDAPLTFGDVAGITLKKWQGNKQSRAEFFTENPLEIAKQQVHEETGEGEVKRIKLLEESGEEDLFLKVLATEALASMHKMSKRVVTVAFPQTQEWVIAEMELVKVKKDKRASKHESAVPVETEGARAAEGEGQDHDGRDELVKRMASLSKMGNQGSGLIASVKTKLESRSSIEPNGEVDTSLRRMSSLGQTDDAPVGYVPVLLAGLQLPGERRGSLRSSAVEQVENHALDPVPTTSTTSLAAKVIEPLKNSTIETDENMGKHAQLPAMSSDLERLMKEQSDLARLRAELEENKRKLQSEDVGSNESVPTTSKNGVGSKSPSASEHKPGQGKLVSSFTPSSFALMGSSAPSFGMSSTYGTSTTSSGWTPPKLDSFTPSAFALPSQPPPAIPPAPSSYSSSLMPYNSRTFSSYSSTNGATPGSSPDVENGIIRLQRSSTSIESTLQDLQSKMDRLLNLQNSMKAGKFVANSGKYAGGASFSSSTSSSSSSSSMLLRNLEKALAQRDELQDINARLQEANGELESNMEDLQSQQESLQVENRTLLDKLQNGNYLQQEKFRMELRGVQQQLSHTQEQMMAYQEENFKLRAELAAKDEQLAKEKARLQEETHKQLEQLQQQVKDEVRQGSKDSMERMATEKAALEAQVVELTAQKKQWDIEREVMAKRLSQAQNQQVELQDESAKSQAAQNSRVQELVNRVQQLESESMALKQQTEGSHSEVQHLEELLASKEKEMTQLLAAKNDQEYAALSELFKEFMNDIYFHFQDAFDEDTEFTGKEIVMAMRKLLKQNTMDILAKLEEFYHQQTSHRQ